MLMSYVKVNSFFYGQRHISSGLYFVTKQVDRVDGQGYRTELSLLRFGGDEDYITKQSSLSQNSTLPAVTSNSYGGQATTATFDRSGTLTGEGASRSDMSASGSGRGGSYRPGKTVREQVSPSTSGAYRTNVVEER